MTPAEASSKYQKMHQLACELVEAGYAVAVQTTPWANVISDIHKVQNDERVARNLTKV